jgi:hypothetical protein
VTIALKNCDCPRLPLPVDTAAQGGIVAYSGILASEGVLLDLTGQGRNATIQNYVSGGGYPDIVDTPHHGKAVRCRHAAYGPYANPPVGWATLTAATVEIVCKLEDYVGYNYRIIAITCGSSGMTWYVSIENPSTAGPTIAVGVHIGGTTWTSLAATLNADNAGHWMHVVHRHSPATGTDLFINGERVAHDAVNRRASADYTTTYRGVMGVGVYDTPKFNGDFGLFHATTRVMGDDEIARRALDAARGFCW